MSEELNLKESSYQQIKEMIILGKLKPSSHVKEKELLELLKISRTPLREAMGKLEYEGWLTLSPGKGAKILDFNLRYIHEVFETRKHFEPNILKISVNHITEFELIFFKEKFSSSLEYSEFENDKLDNDFHNMLLNSSNNRHLIKMFENIYDHAKRIRNLSQKSESRIIPAREEHLSIIDYLLERKLENAIIALEKHIENSKIEFLKNM